VSHSGELREDAVWDRVLEDICELESTAGKYGGKYGDHYVCTAGPDPASRLVTYSKSDQWLVTSGQPQAKKI
jgi:hypothetical protein